MTLVLLETARLRRKKAGHARGGLRRSIVLGDHAHAEVEDVGVRGSGERGVHGLERAGGELVVLIKQEHVVALRGKHAVAPSAQRAAVLVALDDAHARVCSRDRARKRGRVVRAEVVHDDDLEVRRPLAKRARKALPYVGRPVVRGNDYGKARHMPPRPSVAQRFFYHQPVR